MARSKFLIFFRLLTFLFFLKPASTRTTTLLEKNHASSSNVICVPNNTDYIVATNVAPPPGEESYCKFTPFYSRRLGEGFGLLEGGRGGSRSTVIKLAKLFPGPSPSGESSNKSHEALLLTFMIVAVCIVFFGGVAVAVVTSLPSFDSNRY